MNHVVSLALALVLCIGMGALYNTERTRTDAMFECTYRAQQAFLADDVRAGIAWTNEAARAEHSMVCRDNDLVER